VNSKQRTITVNDSKNLLQVLKRWSLTKKKLVIAIDGYIGSGKTSLLEDIAKQNKNVVPVFGDDFTYTLSQRLELVTNSSDKPILPEQNFIDFDIIRKLVKTFRHSSELSYPVKLPAEDRRYYDLTRPIMIVEGLFLFHPLLLDDLWDRRIYLDLGAINIRKQKATHIVETVYKQYLKQYRPQVAADLIVDTADAITLKHLKSSNM
jgi:uridine kinase